MWIYTEVWFPYFLGGYRRQGFQLVSIEGARIYVKHEGLKGVLVAEYPTGKRIGLYVGDPQEAQQNFQFILQAIESGYNYLDLVYVRDSLGPIRKPPLLEIPTNPVPLWEPPAETQRSAGNWLAPQYRQPGDPIPPWEPPQQEPEEQEE